MEKQLFFWAVIKAIVSIFVLSYSWFLDHLLLLKIYLLVVFFI